MGERRTNYGIRHSGRALFMPDFMLLFVKLGFAE
jgi:hypothetical protein